jgi:hypothetical protein
MILCSMCLGTGELAFIPDSSVNKTAHHSLLTCATCGGSGKVNSNEPEIWTLITESDPWDEAMLEHEYQVYLKADELFKMMRKDDPRRKLVLERFIIGFGG